MQGGTSLFDEIRALPDYGRKWLEFDPEVDNIGTAPELIDQGFVLDMLWKGDEAMLDDGMHSLRRLMCRFMLIYPIYSSSDYVIGRVESSEDVFFQLLWSAEVVEERFYGEWRAGNFMFYFSTRLSDDSIHVFQRSLTDMMGGRNGSTDMASFHHGKLIECSSKLQFTEKLKCMVCASVMKCTCSSREDKLALSRAKIDEYTKHANFSAGDWSSMREFVKASSPYKLGLGLSIQKVALSDAGTPSVVYFGRSENVVVQLNFSLNGSAMDALKSHHIQSFLFRSAFPLNNFYSSPLSSADHSELIAVTSVGIIESYPDNVSVPCDPPSSPRSSYCEN